MTNRYAQLPWSIQAVDDCDSRSSDHANPPDMTSYEYVAFGSHLAWRRISRAVSGKSISFTTRSDEPDVEFPQGPDWTSRRLVPQPTPSPGCRSCFPAVQIRSISNAPTRAPEQCRG